MHSEPIWHIETTATAAKEGMKRFVVASLMISNMFMLCVLALPLSTTGPVVHMFTALKKVSGFNAAGRGKLESYGCTIT